MSLGYSEPSNGYYEDPDYSLLKVSTTPYETPVSTLKPRVSSSPAQPAPHEYDYAATDSSPTQLQAPSRPAPQGHTYDYAAVSPGPEDVAVVPPSTGPDYAVLEHTYQYLESVDTGPPSEQTVGSDHEKPNNTAPLPDAYHQA